MVPINAANRFVTRNGLGDAPPNQTTPRWNRASGCTKVTFTSLSHNSPCLDLYIKTIPCHRLSHPQFVLKVSAKYHLFLRFFSLLVAGTLVYYSKTHRTQEHAWFSGRCTSCYLSVRSESLTLLLQGRILWRSHRESRQWPSHFSFPWSCSSCFLLIFFVFNFFSSALSTEFRVSHRQDRALPLRYLPNHRFYFRQTFLFWVRILQGCPGWPWTELYR